MMPGDVAPAGRQAQGVLEDVDDDLAAGPLPAVLARRILARESFFTTLTYFLK